MQIALRILREFWIPALVAGGWTAYIAHSTKTSLEFKDLVSTFGTTFVLTSWTTGQFFRIQKQVGVDQTLTNLNAQIEALTKLTQTQATEIKRILDVVVPERRADPLKSDPLDEVIPLSRVVEFYDAIADLYDKRNTGKYLATYVEINASIRSLLPSLNAISICDLGGGTGALLRWFEKDLVHWTNVDISRRSLDVFEKTFANYHRKYHRIVDVRDGVFFEPEKQFDIIVMNYLLSSLDRMPDFGRIRDAMHEKSLLVVADNHFSYVQENPRYGYTGVLGRNLSIRPNPMRPDALREQIQAAGFVEISYRLVSLDGISPYSQVLVFKRKHS